MHQYGNYRAHEFCDYQAGGKNQNQSFIKTSQTPWNMAHNMQGWSAKALQFSK